jgi:hypothetical protein
MQNIESLGQNAITLLFFSFFFMIVLFSFLLWIGWWVSTKRGSPCPYTRKPMKLGVDVAASVLLFVEEFLRSHPQPENAPFDFRFAAISPETGRIFPDCVKKMEIVRLDWSFIQKRYPGKYVSWGSLSEMEQGHVRLCHESLAGFQTEKSCPNPVPQDITSEFALLRPGPLYVDRATKVLLGWKEVHGTDFEVLIVQKPIYQSIDETL